jgi:drug/metabolite transporter (DMT)-like permease
VANSTLLTNIAPVFVTLGAWLFLREQVTARFAVGLALALGGCALLLGSSVQLGREHLRGDALALFAALFYGGYLLMVKVLRRRFPTPILMAWAGLASCPGFGLVALATGDNLVPGSVTSWLALVSLALVSHVGGQTLITYGFGHLPASFSSVSLLWQPVVAAGAAWLFLAEPVGWLQAAGGAIVLAGILVTSRSLAPTSGLPTASPSPAPSAERL